MSALGRLAGNENGGVAIIFALALVPLAGMVGMALDYSRAAAAKVELQNEVDAAVLAGAASGSRSAAEKMFAGLHRDNPATAEFALSGNVLAGSARSEVDSVMLGLIGFDRLEIAASAKAEFAPGGDPVCVLVKNAGDSQALRANSGVTLNAPHCQIHVRAGTYMDNAGNIRPARLCTRRYGGNNGRPAGLETDCEAVADPFAGKMPIVTLPANDCSAGNGTKFDDRRDITLAGGNYCNLTFNGSRDKVAIDKAGNLRNVQFNDVKDIYLTPGLYENITFNNGQRIHLAPGLYIWKSATNLTARMTGDQVTIYYPDENSVIRTNNGGSFELTAPLAGIYGGILFFEKSGLALRDLRMNGGPISNLTGLIYLPSRQIHFNASSKIDSSRITMVVDKLSWDGGMVWNLSPGPLAIGAGGANAVRLIN